MLCQARCLLFWPTRPNRCYRPSAWVPPPAPISSRTVTCMTPFFSRDWYCVLFFVFIYFILFLFLISFLFFFFASFFVSFFVPFFVSFLSFFLSFYLAIVWLVYFRSVCSDFESNQFTGSIPSVWTSIAGFTWYSSLVWSSLICSIFGDNLLNGSFPGNWHALYLYDCFVWIDRIIWIIFESIFHKMQYY
jgi:hypothetical protein